MWICCSGIIPGQMSRDAGSQITCREKLLVGVARLLGADDHLATLNLDINNTLKSVCWDFPILKHILKCVLCIVNISLTHTTVELRQRNIVSIVFWKSVQHSGTSRYAKSGIHMLLVGTDAFVKKCDQRHGFRCITSVCWPENGFILAKTRWGSEGSGIAMEAGDVGENGKWEAEGGKFGHFLLYNLTTG